LIQRIGEPVRLNFDTITVEGVSYHFNGTYLKNTKTALVETHLEGVMRKMMNGQKVAETKLRFSAYNILE